MTNVLKLKKAERKEDVPWDGGLDLNEMSRKGGLLLAALVNHAQSRGEQMATMADRLGVTAGYICQLRGGTREVYQISDAFAQKCADYLGIPRINVLMMAGKVTPQDFMPSAATVEQEMGRAMAFVAKDHTWGPLVTEELLKSSVASQYLIVRLYEKATKKQLLGAHVEISDLVSEIAKINALKDELNQESASSVNA